MSRRRFLVVMTAAAAVVPGPSSLARRTRSLGSPAADPFTLGVASGDPQPGSVVLWTCLAPRPLEPDGGLRAAPYEVDWELSSAPSMRPRIRGGRFETRAEHTHAVHVVADGLRSGRDYWYRFRCGRWISPTGRTRTSPSPGQRLDALSWVTASCQSWETGHYTAHRHLATEDVDLVLFLGDFIYERRIEGSRRGRALDEETTAEADTLDRYRRRYALTVGDADLQRARRAAPWIVTWDDHEVQDNYAGTHPGRGTADGFARRRHAAYQAFWEHQPIRVGPPSRPALRVHRRATYGDLVTFHVLDTRQYRSSQVDGPHWQPDSPERSDPRRTMLGRAQEAWLAEGLARSRTTWNIVAQQVLAGRLDLEPGAELFNRDAWDGYRAAQARLHDGLALATNPVVITGDVHAAYALDVEREPEGEPVAVELTATSISSGGDGAPILPAGRAYRAANPHMEYVNQQRGYLRCRLEPAALTADFRTVPFVERPGAPIATDRSFTVEAGRARLRT